MEFIIDREMFLGGLQKLLGVADKRTTSPILNNIHLVVAEGDVTIKATDLEISVIVTFDAQVKKEGKILLPARKVSEMLREMQGVEVHFNGVEEHTVEMICGNAAYKIQGLDDEEYPIINVKSEKDVLSISAQKLSQMIRKSIFSSSNEAMCRNINGVYFEISDGNTVRMVGTDGNRLSLFGMSVENIANSIDKGLIVGKRGISELRKNIDGLNGNVDIGLMGNFVIVRAGNMMMQLNTIEADYPDYRRVIALSESNPLIGNKDEILRALRITRVVAEASAAGVAMDISKDKIRFTSIDFNIGEASDEIIVQYSGKEFNLSYNVNFLIEAIDAVESEEVLLDFGMGGKPVFIKDKENDNYLAVVMPVRLM